MPTDRTSPLPPAPSEVRRTIVLLTEEPVQRQDADRILALHDGDEVDYLVLVPADTHRSLLGDVVDALSLADVAQAAATVRTGEPSAEAVRLDADGVLEVTLAALRSRGRRVEGRVVADDPLPAVSEAVAHAVQRGAAEVVVITRPHALAETFHRDWASRARASLGVPVLHVYGGTGFVR